MNFYNLQPNPGLSPPALLPPFWASALDFSRWKSRTTFCHGYFLHVTAISTELQGRCWHFVTWPSSLVDVVLSHRFLSESMNPVSFAIFIIRARCSVFVHFLNIRFFIHTHTHVHTERESLNLLDVNFLTVKSCLGRRKSCLGRRKMRQRKVQAAKVHAPLRPSPCVYSGIDAGRPIEQARRMTTPPSNGNTTSCFIGLITI